MIDLRSRTRTHLPAPSQQLTWLSQTNTENMSHTDVPRSCDRAFSTAMLSPRVCDRACHIYILCSFFNNYKPITIHNCCFIQPRIFFFLLLLCFSILPFCVEVNSVVSIYIVCCNFHVSN